MILQKLKALSDQKRLEILRTLKERSPRYVQGIASALGMRPSVCSHHLNILSREGFVFFEQSGQYRLYYWSIEGFSSFLENLNEFFEQKETQDVNAEGD